MRYDISELISPGYGFNTNEPIFYQFYHLSKNEYLYDITPAQVILDLPILHMFPAPAYFQPLRAQYFYSDQLTNAPQPTGSN